MADIGNGGSLTRRSRSLQSLDLALEWLLFYCHVFILSFECFVRPVFFASSYNEFII